MITVYTKTVCPMCLQMKKLLQLKGIEFREVNIEEDGNARMFLISEGHKSVPQLYAGEEHIDTTVQKLMTMTADEIGRLV